MAEQMVDTLVDPRAAWKASQSVASMAVESAVSLAAAKVSQWADQLG